MIVIVMTTTDKMTTRARMSLEIRTVLLAPKYDYTSPLYMIRRRVKAIPTALHHTTNEPLVEEEDAEDVKRNDTGHNLFQSINKK